jgi:hypothetical protein
LLVEVWFPNDDDYTYRCGEEFKTENQLEEKEYEKDNACKIMAAEKAHRTENRTKKLDKRETVEIELARCVPRGRHY